MSRFKLIAFIALITLAFAVTLVGDALAGEKGKLVSRLVFHVTTFQSVKVGDVEGHTIWLIEQKAIFFNPKWGAGLLTTTGMGEDLNGEWTGGGFDQYTFPDGSTYTDRWEGRSVRRGRNLDHRQGHGKACRHAGPWYMEELPHGSWPVLLGWGGRVHAPVRTSEALQIVSKLNG